MKMIYKNVIFIILNLCLIIANSQAQKCGGNSKKPSKCGGNSKILPTPPTEPSKYGESSQKPTKCGARLNADGSNPLVDIAATLLQGALANGEGGGNGILGLVNLLGSFGQQQDPSKPNNIGAMNPNQMQPTPSNANGDPAKQQGMNIESMMNIASLFMGPQSGDGNGGLMNLLPVALQALTSFNGPEGDKASGQQKDFLSFFSPYLEQIYAFWDQFVNSEHGQAVLKATGADAVIKELTGEDGKIDSDKLFEYLHNQSFRRKWIDTAIVHLSARLSYIAQPEIFNRYSSTVQMMFNAILQQKGFPSNTLFDPQQPSESIANLLDFLASEYLQKQISTIIYVQPAVTYVQDSVESGRLNAFFEKLNAEGTSDKITDTLNLEIIEPILKVHRAYRFALKSPQCDAYVLCEVNSRDPNELTGYKAGITKYGSMAAAWFISRETGTPYMTLFAALSGSQDCKEQYPADCSGFQEKEAIITTEYIHSEL